MSWTLFWAEWQLWADRVTGYHVVSFVLHLLNALLCWRLLARLGLRWAWLAALLFAIHPLAVESVAWITETKNTLSLSLFLASLAAYIDYDEMGGKPRYVFSLLLYLAALLSKSSVVMLPGVILLFCWWKRRQVSGRDLAEDGSLLVGCARSGLPDLAG